MLPQLKLKWKRTVKGLKFSEKNEWEESLSHKLLYNPTFLFFATRSRRRPLQAIWKNAGWKRFLISTAQQRQIEANEHAVYSPWDRRSFSNGILYGNMDTTNRFPFSETQRCFLSHTLHLYPPEGNFHFGIWWHWAESLPIVTDKESVCV